MPLPATRSPAPAPLLPQNPIQLPTTPTTLLSPTRVGGGQTAPTIIRMAAPVGGAGGGQILRTIGGQQVVRVRAPAPTLASGQQIKVVGSSGQIIKSTTVSAAQAAQGKVETILKGSLDSIPSPSPSVKIRIMGRKVCLRCKGKTLFFQKFVDNAQQCFAFTP